MRTALAAAVAAARRQGSTWWIWVRAFRGARVTARLIAHAARTAFAGARRPTCVLGSGEVTVSVRGTGIGGRCQELAWAIIPEIHTFPGASFTALATDGRDFLAGTMGATVTSETYRHLERVGLDWHTILDDNDSGRRLRVLGCDLPAVPTNTNVCDVYVLASATHDGRVWHREPGGGADTGVV